jgi:hypothetical protein
MQEFVSHGTNMTVNILTCITSSPNIIRMIKLMRIRWEGHVASIGEEWTAYKCLVGNPV